MEGITLPKSPIQAFHCFQLSQILLGTLSAPNILFSPEFTTSMLAAVIEASKTLALRGFVHSAIGILNSASAYTLKNFSPQAPQISVLLSKLFMQPRGVRSINTNLKN